MKEEKIKKTKNKVKSIHFSLIIRNWTELYRIMNSSSITQLIYEGAYQDNSKQFLIVIKIHFVLKRGM